MTQSRSNETETAYLLRAGQLDRRFSREAGPGALDDLDGYVEWLSALRGTVTPATWRCYRAASAYHFEHHGKPVQAAKIRALDNVGCLPRARQRDGHARTSARKQKHLSPNDRKALHDALRISGSRYAPALRLALEATRIVGLRPAEWATARMDLGADGENLLVVTNAKHSNDRAHGEYRTLRLGMVSKKELSVVVRMAQVGHQQQAQWQRFYEGLRKTMQETTFRLWPSRKTRPSLYSARHQFAADAKAAGMSKAEVAALMGHAVDETATTHYGKKRRGRRGAFRVRPDAREVARVRAAMTKGERHAASSGR